jgi:hypothetical protein
MGVIMRELAVVLFCVAVLCASFIFLVDLANAKETTTLEDALERPVKVEKYVDTEEGVVCYWVQRYPKYLTCVKVDDDTRD